MHGNGTTRRGVLAGAGACGVAGLAGCAGLPFGGDDTEKNYATWMRSGEPLNEQHLDFSVVRPSALDEHRSHVPDGFDLDDQPYVPRDRGTDEAGFGVDVRELDAVVGVGQLQYRRLGAHVLSGPYERGALEEYLDGAGYEHRSTYGGFDVWGRHVPDFRPSEGDQGRFTNTHLLEGQTVAFDGDLLVTGIVFHYNALSTVEATIDAIRGNVDRYPDVNDDGDELLAQLGSGQVRNGYTHEELTAEWASDVRGGFEGQVARGIRFQVQGERTELRLVRVFSDAQQVNLDAVREYLATLPEIESIEGGEIVHPYEDFEASVERRGRSALVTGTVPTADLTTKHWP